MIVTCAGFKGGVGKSMTAIHIARFLSGLAPTVLIDGDPNRSASEWASRSEHILPFRVVDERQAARAARDATHAVVDTQARPTADDLRAVAGGCDLLILPSTPDLFSIRALMRTVQVLRELKADRFKVLLTIVPPKPSRDGEDAREAITGAGLPIFAGQVRRAIAFQKAVTAGTTVADLKDPRSADGWEDYRRIGEELTS